MIELQQLCIQYCHVFGLKRLLLCAEEVVFFGQQLYRIFHAHVKLFAHQVIAGLCAVQFLPGGYVALLGCVGIQPETFDGFIQVFLLIQQVQHTGFTLEFGFLHGAFRLAVIEDGDAHG